MPNRTAFVTGASRGIGLACAHALASTGARVILAARDAAKLEAASAAIPGSTWITLDMSSQESIKAAFAQAGPVDILVNNAAVTKDGLALRMKKDDWDAVLQTNLTGAHLCIQQALPTMMKVRAGRIINISSIVAQMGNAGQANYVAAKAGLIGLTKAIAIEIASRGITVNAVAPGFMETPMTDVLPDKVKEELKVRIPLGRMGSARDVAAAIVFLASNEAGYITGHVLNVNGGMHLA